MEPIPEEFQPTVNAQDIRKTKLCRHFLRGLCWRGDECMFAHGKQELRTEYKLYKTTMCHYFQSGTCLYGSRCRYAHYQMELRGRPEEEQNPPRELPIEIPCVLCGNAQDPQMIMLQCGHALHRKCFFQADVNTTRQCPLCLVSVDERRQTPPQPRPMQVQQQFHGKPQQPMPRPRAPHMMIHQRVQQPQQDDQQPILMLAQQMQQMQMQPRPDALVQQQHQQQQPQTQQAQQPGYYLF